MVDLILNSLLIGCFDFRFLIGYKYFLACLSDKRDEIKDLRHQLREKEEAFARQNAEIQILKRQLRDQERDFNRARRQSNNLSNSVLPSNDKHDIAINLQDGNQDDYGKIEQVKIFKIIFVTPFDLEMTPNELT